MLRGQIAMVDYPAAAANLNALKEAGEIIRATLLEQNGDDDDKET